MFTDTFNSKKRYSNNDDTSVSQTTVDNHLFTDWHRFLSRYTLDVSRDCVLNTLQISQDPAMMIQNLLHPLQTTSKRLTENELSVTSPAVTTWYFHTPSRPTPSAIIPHHLEQACDTSSAINVCYSINPPVQQTPSIIDFVPSALSTWTFTGLLHCFVFPSNSYKYETVRIRLTLTTDSDTSPGRNCDFCPALKHTQLKLISVTFWPSR